MLKLIRATLVALVLVPSILSAKTVTDINEVVYDIIEGTTDVKISANNAYTFKDQRVEITIPAIVYDKSTTSGYDRIPYNVIGIQESAFENCRGLQTITIEAEIPEIAKNAFHNCSGLKSVNFPGSVTKILESAFEGCDSLTAISNIGHLTNIYLKAFKDCKLLPSIDLPESLSALGSQSFSGCETLDNVVIPSKITLIPSNCFELCSGMKSLTLNYGLKQIGGHAFNGCTLLKAPDFPSTVVTLNGYCFADCFNLGTLKFNSGMKVDAFAFFHSGIDEIVWPASAMTLSTSIFAKTFKLNDVTIPSWMTTVPARTFQSSYDLETVYFSDGVSTLSEYSFSSCRSLTTLNFSPASVKNIEQFAFTKDSVLTDPTFPAVMSSIGEKAFQYCVSLDKITLPSGANIGKQIFEGCNLSEIHFPATAMGNFEINPFGTQTNVTTITLPTWMKTVPQKLCSGWSGLSSLIIEDGVETFGESAFSSCNSLETLSFPPSVKIIGESAFSNLKSLISVSFSEGLHTLGKESFGKCEKLETLEFPASLTNTYWSFSNCSGLKTVTFKPGMQTLGSCTFASCTSLQTVTLPTTLEVIESSAFAGCKELTGPVFPTTLRELGSSAFSNCERFGELTLLTGMVIGNYAFSGAGVSQINYPETPCKFGEYVFERNSRIYHLSFPEWLTVIPVGFFQKSSGLKSVTLHDGITEIGKEAFYSNLKLHDVKFPDSLKLIGEKGFAACNIDELIDGVQTYFGEVILPDGIHLADDAFFSSTVTKIGFKGCATFDSNCFFGLKQLTEFSFPTCMDVIPAGFCGGWEKLEKVVIPATCTKICDDAFRGCENLVSIKINGADNVNNDEIKGLFLPATLDSIGSYAFASTAISDIPWPDSPIYVGEGAFSSTKLEKLTVPRWLNPVPDYCFDHCSDLIQLDWERADGDSEDDKVDIGSFAFNGCSSLPEIVLPEPGCYLGSYAFGHCTSAKHIIWPEGESSLYSKKDKYSSYVFSECTSLEDVDIPDYITKIPSYCFNKCSSLTKANIGKNVSYIDNNAFFQSGLRDVTWPEVYFDIKGYSFSECGFVDLTLSPKLETIYNYAFYNNKTLTTLTFAEGNKDVNTYGFAQCSALKSVKLSSTVRSLGTFSFYYDKALNNIEIPDGLQTIGSQAFKYCSALPEITLPSTVTSIESNVFEYCSSLKKFNSNATDLKIGSYCFNGCPLETVNVTGHINAIGSYAFQNIKTLTDFNYSDERGIGDLGSNVFSGCVKLKAFPYLTTGAVGDYCFRNCTTLRQMTMPYSGAFTNSLSSPSNYLYGAQSMESIIFPCTGSNFKLKPQDIHGAPLRALSYSYAQDIVPLGASQKATILKYPGTGYYTVGASGADKPKLMVKRGEKWKYMEAGYGEAFDIIEIKAPRIKIEGDIWSTYNFERDVNEYKAYLRWDVPLSDLNENDSTTVEVFRDNKSVANVVFSKPSEPQDANNIYDSEGKKVNFTDAEKVIVVDVTVNGKPNKFVGDFDFPELKSNNDTIYKLIYAKESDRMYFDATTHKRLVAFDKYGYTSWFIMVDKFDSEPLNNPGPAGIPTKYVYSATMKGYDYLEFENNTDLKLENDSLYHRAVKTFKTVEATPCTMYTAMAAPSLDFDGLYTTDQILEDVVLKWPYTRKHADQPRSYKIDFALDPNLLAQKGLEDNSTTERFIIDGVKVYDVTNGDSIPVATFKLPSTNRQKVTTLSLPSGAVPGNKYQIITTSLFRGTFGSEVIIIPDAPTLMAVLNTPTINEHNGNGHSGYRRHAIVSLIPNVADMGYSDEHPMTSEDYHLGMWRSLQSIPTEQSIYYSLSDMANTICIHHPGDLPEGFHATDCDDCAAAVGPDTDQEGNMIFHDYFDVPTHTTYSLDYTPRIYVKVPTKTIGEEEKWMIAEADPQPFQETTLSGVEDVCVDKKEGREYRYFDLQGRPLAAPIPGKPCIQLSPNGNTVVLR